jgi:GMP synthase (glutamine-hydrolysing)
MKPVVHLIDVTNFSLRDGSKSTDWFREAFRSLELLESIDFRSYDGVAGKHPELALATEHGHGIVVSGSSGPVFEKKWWIATLVQFLHEAHDAGAWILGVCFGHQALAMALGGTVTFNPRGREMGTVPVYLTKEGEQSPLFRGFASGEMANLVHRTHVAKMPKGAVRLAFNQITSTQAFQLGRSFGVQPHPEFTPVELRGLTDLYSSVLTKTEHFLDDEEHLKNFVATFRDTPSFRLILRNFVGMMSGE